MDVHVYDEVAGRSQGAQLFCSVLVDRLGLGARSMRHSCERVVEYR